MIHHSLILPYKLIVSLFDLLKKKSIISKARGRYVIPNLRRERGWIGSDEKN